MRLITGEDEVAHHRELAPAAEREAVDRGDERLLRLAQLLPASERVVAHQLRVLERLHLLDVRAAANAFSDPVSTIAPTASSASNARVAATTSCITSELSALSAFGRLRVMSPTLPRVSVSSVL